LGEQLTDPDFRHAFEQRRLIHEVAVHVREMRKDAGLTQAALARKIGTSQPAIARIEKGLEQRTPKFDTLQKIATALGWQLKLVFGQPRESVSLVEVEPLRQSRSPRSRSRPTVPEARVRAD